MKYLNDRDWFEIDTTLKAYTEIASPVDPQGPIWDYKYSATTTQSTSSLTSTKACDCTLSTEFAQAKANHIEPKG